MPAAYQALDWPFKGHSAGLMNGSLADLSYAERMEVIAYRTRMWLSKLN